MTNPYFTALGPSSKLVSLWKTVWNTKYPCVLASCASRQSSVRRGRADVQTEGSSGFSTVPCNVWRIARGQRPVPGQLNTSMAKQDHEETWLVWSAGGALYACSSPISRPSGPLPTALTTQVDVDTFLTMQQEYLQMKKQRVQDQQQMRQ